VLGRFFIGFHSWLGNCRHVFLLVFIVGKEIVGMFLWIFIVGQEIVGMFLLVFIVSWKLSDM
jgi:hypothetical protein